MSVVKKCPTCGAVEEDPELMFCAKDGTPLQTLENHGDALLGKVIAERYEIIEPLGEGGMGTVYRAKQLGIEREVALKIIRAELAAEPSLQARFTREARSASRVQSIRIVTLHDYGRTDDGLMYMAMELLDGESIGERLAREGALSPKEAVHVATEIARALEAAHELDVVHRDLKPDNVFLTDKEQLVKVLDFGIAKIVSDDQLEADSQLTAVGAIVGTPVYMSPEAAAARGGVGPSADLYSLGVMLFEMLTGVPPFNEDEPVLLLGMHLRARPPLLRETAPELDVPDALEELVDRLLSKVPDKRPASATALIEELGALDGLSDETLKQTRERTVPKTLAIADPSGASRRASARTPPTEQEKRASVPASVTPPPAVAAKRSLVPAIAAVSIALGAIGGVVWWSQSGSDEPELGPAATAPAEPEATARGDEEPSESVPEELAVVIRTVPADAEIAIDGLVRDNPFRAVLARGDVVALRVRAEGFEEHAESITVESAIDRTVELTEVAAPRERPSSAAARAQRPEETSEAAPEQTPEPTSPPQEDNPLAREEAAQRRF